MNRIQIGAGIMKSPEELKSYYKDCLSTTRLPANDSEDMEAVAIYINACVRRLDSEPSAFNELRKPPIFQMPDGILAYSTDNGIVKLIG